MVDATHVAVVQRQIEALGVDVHLAEHDLHAASSISDRVQQKLRESDAVVVLVTNNSVDSSCVHQEVGLARSHRKPIVPVVDKRVDKSRLGMLAEVEWLEIDLDDPTEALARVTQSLQPMVQSEGVRRARQTPTPVAAVQADTVMLPKIPMTRQTFLTSGAIGFVSLFGGYGARARLLTHAVSPRRATQPSGNGIVPYQNLKGSTFSARVNSAPSGDRVSLAPGTFSLKDFSDGTQTIAVGASAEGANLTAAGILGSGAASTILEMAPGSSTKWRDVPAQSTGATNNLCLLMMNRANSIVDGLTIQGTAQGHYYNGLRFEAVVSPTLSNCVINAIPGDAGAPPGETFHVNCWRCGGTITWTNLQLDGGTVGASGLAANSCSGKLVASNIVTNNMKYSAGIALWQQTGPVSITNWRANGCERALGLERCNVTIDLYDCVMTGSTSGHDIMFASDTGTGTLNLRYSSQAKTPTKKVQILLGSLEQGHPQRNTPANVNVYVAGTKVSTSQYVLFV